jgi:hypothetical protein
MQQVVIHVKGLIDPNWSAQLAGLQVLHTADGYTILTGAVRDQSALYGLLLQLSNLGLQLVSVSPGGVKLGNEEV